jgi:pyruvate ferredoxin oxidoreductase beta subunit
MNTGVQRSSATPPGSRTATTPAIGSEPGEAFGQGKWMPAIALAHEIPYVATASICEPRDLERKVRKAMSIRGARYLQVDVPCPLGWGSDTAKSVQISRMGVESGLMPLVEGEYGEWTSSVKIRNRVPVEEYLKLQRRFAHITSGKAPEELEQIRARAQRNIVRYHLEDDGLPAPIGDAPPAEARIPDSTPVKTIPVRGGAK